MFLIHGSRQNETFRRVKVAPDKALHSNMHTKPVLLPGQSRKTDLSLEDLAYRSLYLILLGATMSGADRVALSFDEMSGVVQIKDNGNLKFTSRGLTMLHERIRQGLKSIERWSPSLFRIAGAALCSAELKVVTQNCSMQMNTALFLQSGVKSVDEDRPPVEGVSLSFTLAEHARWNTQTMRKTLTRLAVGCSIHISFNDEPVPSAQAYSEHFAPFQYGHYDLSFTPRSQSKRATVYRNGLPVRMPAAYCNLPGALTIHIDAHQIQGHYDESTWEVMISDADAAFIHSEMTQIWYRYLESQKAALNPEEFALRYAHACSTGGAGYLLEDTPLHPSMWGLYTRLPGPGQPGLPGQFLYGDRLLKPTDEVVLDLEWIEGWSGSLAATFVYGLSWPVITADVSDGHWALKTALNPVSLNLKVVPYGVAGKQTFKTGLLNGIQVVFCQGYEILCSNYPASVYIEEVPTFCSETATMYVTEHSHRDLQVLIWQIGAYLHPQKKNTLRETIEDAKALLKLMGTVFGLAKKEAPKSAASYAISN